MSRANPLEAEGRAVAVGLFERRSRAERAARALREAGIPEEEIGSLPPGEAPAGSGPGAAARVGSLLAAAAGAGDLRAFLVLLGVPEGEARYYEREVRAGRSLVVARAAGRYDETRGLLRQHGAEDVEARGERLARGPGTPEGGRSPGPTGAPPPDLTTRWEDVVSRYEMLWGQHYGTRGGAWEEYEPYYREAWEMANRPALRGRAWPEARRAVRQEWESRHASPTWDDVAGLIEDVWNDVADEARTGAEGGAQRRTARPVE